MRGRSDPDAFAVIGKIVLFIPLIFVAGFYGAFVLSKGYDWLVAPGFGWTAKPSLVAWWGLEIMVSSVLAGVVVSLADPDSGRFPYLMLVLIGMVTDTIFLAELWILSTFFT